MNRLIPLIGKVPSVAPICIEIAAKCLWPCPYDTARHRDQPIQPQKAAAKTSAAAVPQPNLRQRGMASRRFSQARRSTPVCSQ